MTYEYTPSLRCYHCYNVGLLKVLNSIDVDEVTYGGIPEGTQAIVAQCPACNKVSLLEYTWVAQPHYHQDEGEQYEVLYPRKINLENIPENVKVILTELQDSPSPIMIRKCLEVALKGKTSAANLKQLIIKYKTMAAESHELADVEYICNAMEEIRDFGNSEAHDANPKKANMQELLLKLREILIFVFY